MTSERRVLANRRNAQKSSGPRTPEGKAKPKDATATANRDALENALTSIGGTVRGLCANRGPHKGQLCTANSTCDSTPGSGDDRG